MKGTWRECRECGSPIGDADELCRELTCSLYGKRAVVLNERSPSTKGELITVYCTSGVFEPDPAIWERLLRKQQQDGGFFNFTSNIDTIYDVNRNGD